MTGNDATVRLVSHSCATGVKHLVDRGREITNPGARDNDRVPSPVRFLRDPEKSPAVVFTKLDVETLSFDLELLRLDDAIHFPKNGAV